jgi:hypothetical protein
MLTPRFRLLKDEVVACIGSLLGTYQIGTNLEIAILVVPPEPRPTWKVSGIEAIVSRVPIAISSEGSHGGSTRRETWQISLTQYDKSNYDSLSSAKDKLADYFGGSVTVSYYPQTEETYEKAIFYLNLDRYIIKR